MRLLLDECVPLAWAPFLERDGHPVSVWSREHTGGALDDDVAAWAAANGHAVLTCDTDFGQQLWFRRAGRPTTIQLGGPTWLPETYGPAVLTAIRACDARQPAEFFVRIAATGGRFKLIGLPLR